MIRGEEQNYYNWLVTLIDKQVMSGNMEDMANIIGDPSEILRRANTFPKSDWLNIAAHYGMLEVEGGWTKREIRAAVERNLRARLGMDEQEEGEPLRENEDLRDEEEVEAEPPRENVEAMKLQLELDFMREQAALDREHEKRLAQLRAEPKENDEVYKVRSMMPSFTESEPEMFFAAFENLAQTLGLEERYWALLTLTVFPGKAQAAYLWLEGAARKDYQRVKDKVLEAYGLTPERS